MCLLSISAGKFIFIAFGLLCFYELGIYLYFKFVKKDSSSISKNEARKMREMKAEVSPGMHAREAAPKVPQRSQGASSDWEDLIDYRKSASDPVTSNRKDFVDDCRGRVVDAFGSSSSQMDFSCLDRDNKRLVDDLLGVNTAAPAVNSESLADKESAQSDVLRPEKESAAIDEDGFSGRKDAVDVIEEKSSSDASAAFKTAFSNIDYSNMM